DAKEQIAVRVGGSLDRRLRVGRRAKGGRLFLRRRHRVRKPIPPAQRAVRALRSSAGKRGRARRWAPPPPSPFALRLSPGPGFFPAARSMAGPPLIARPWRSSWLRGGLLSPAGTSVALINWDAPAPPSPLHQPEAPNMTLADFLVR